MAVKPGGADDSAERLERLIAQQDRRFQAVFREAIVLIQDRYTLDELTELLTLGRVEEALDAVEAAARLLGNAYGNALASAANNTAQFLSDALTVAVSFDIANVNAIAAINRNSLRLITGFTADQRAAVRQALARGIAQGLNPRDQARLFRQTIGLTPSQEEAVANYRRLLENLDRQSLHRQLRDRRFDRTINRAIVDGAPLSRTQIDTMVGRYRDRYVAYRATVIGRTEALRSVHEGAEVMYQQAIDEGALDPRELQSTWNTASDGRERDTHAAIDGQTKAFGETWNTGGATLRFPGDPLAPIEETAQCRCVLSRRLDPLGV